MSAITPTFYSYNPPTRGNYGSFYIRKPEYMINLLIPEEDLGRQLKTKDQAHHTEMNKLRHEKEEEEKWVKHLREEHRQYQVIIYF